MRSQCGGTRLKVGALTAFAAFVYCLDSLLLFRRFLASTFDLVIFDQGIRGYAHLAAPVSIARGVSDGQSAHFILLADHWSPILALLAPLYWIHDDPTTLLVAQGVLFALAIPPLWAYTRRQLGAAAAYFVCVAYALSLPVMAAVIFDFHEVAFVPVLTAVMVERFDAGRRWGGLAAAAALLLVKEDMGLLVAGYGCYLLLTRRRWTGLAFVVGGLLATWVATHVLIPAFGGSASFYWAYGQFGSTLGGALVNVITHPLHAAGRVLHPVGEDPHDDRAAGGVRLPAARLADGGRGAAAAGRADARVRLSPLVAGEIPVRRVPGHDAVLCRRRRRRPPPAPLAVRRGALPDPPRWLSGYPGSPAPLDLRREGYRRLCTSLAASDLWAAGICAAALVYFPSSPFGPLLHPGFYGTNARIRAAAAAAAHVPSGVEVEAVNNVGPRLSGRDTVLLLDGTPRWAPWVVADTIGLDFPFCSPSQQAQDVDYLLDHGYSLVFADDGYVVLHRPADARTAQALAHPLSAARLHTNVCY